MARYRAAAERKGHDLRQGETWLAEGLEKVALKRKELGRLPGNDARKAALERLIGKNTTVGHQWIAESLGMRSAASASQILRSLDAGELKAPYRIRCANGSSPPPPDLIYDACPDA